MSSQTTLTSFFGPAARPACKKEDEKKDGGIPCERPDVSATRRKRERSVSNGATRTERPASLAAIEAHTFDSYYDAHADEFRALLEQQPKPTATNMAKLFQERPVDAYRRFATTWPRPTAGGASGDSNGAATAGQAEAEHNVIAARGARDDPVPYAAVVDTLADISATGPRLECIHLLTELLFAVLTRTPRDLVPVLYLAMNKQAPQHEGIELGIGDALLVKVIAECCGMTEARVRDEYNKSGDLAEVAQNNKQRQPTLLKPRPLLARDVLASLRDIALMKGKDVVRRRLDVIRRMLTSARGPEVNLIVRALQHMMRIGLAGPSTLAAAGYAFALHFLGSERAASLTPEQLQAALNMGASGFARFFNEVPSLEVVCTTVLRHGFLVLVPSSSVATANADALSIRPGLPVKPQLAHPTSGISVILDRLQGKAFTSEYKYDGERAQIHYRRGSGFHLFSRNSETHTDKYPDVLAALPSVFDAQAVESFIIDSEVVAVDPGTGALQAFQVLQHRGRKNIELHDVTIPVCVFAFDLLYFNGKPLLQLTLQERRAVLWRHFRVVDKKFVFATHLDSDNVEDVQKFLDRSIADGCEGLMIKTLVEDAAYTPAKRSYSWLKLKKDYMDGVTDTLDLVPIGGYYGRGKRTGVFGSFLLACYDPDTEEYQSVCKVSTGFQDDEFEKLTRALQPCIVAEKPRYYRTHLDDVHVWFSESQVWEVKAADLSVSPVHCAAMGLVDATRGIALRFPRYLRVREDKSPTDCTTSQQVAEMYKAQSLAMHKDNEDDDEDE